MSSSAIAVISARGIQRNCRIKYAIPITFAYSHTRGHCLKVSGYRCYEAVYYRGSRRFGSLYLHQKYTVFTLWHYILGPIVGYLGPPLLKLDRKAYRHRLLVHMAWVAP